MRVTPTTGDLALRRDMESTSRKDKAPVTSGHRGFIPLEDEFLIRPEEGKIWQWLTYLQTGWRDLFSI